MSSLNGKKISTTEQNVDLRKYNENWERIFNAKKTKRSKKNSRNTRSS
jgi:hypothetical protein